MYLTRYLSKQGREFAGVESVAREMVAVKPVPVKLWPHTMQYHAGIRKAETHKSNRHVVAIS